MYNFVSSHFLACRGQKKCYRQTRSDIYTDLLKMLSKYASAIFGHFRRINEIDIRNYLLLA